MAGDASPPAWLEKVMHDGIWFLSRGRVRYTPGNAEDIRSCAREWARLFMHRRRLDSTKQQPQLQEAFIQAAQHEPEFPSFATLMQHYQRARVDVERDREQALPAPSMKQLTSATPDTPAKRKFFDTVRQFGYQPRKERRSAGQENN